LITPDDVRHQVREREREREREKWPSSTSYPHPDVIMMQEGLVVEVVV